MKITRQFYKLGDGAVCHAFIQANLLERMGLWLAHRRKRHNLRPSRNWPGLRMHGATWVMRAKGKPNPDMGRNPVPPKWLTIMSMPRFSIADLMVAVGTSLAMEHDPWWATGVLVLHCSLHLLFWYARRKSETTAVWQSRVAEEALRKMRDKS